MAIGAQIGGAGECSVRPRIPARAPTVKDRLVSLWIVKSIVKLALGPHAVTPSPLLTLPLRCLAVRVSHHDATATLNGFVGARGPR
jgi:hypothetical protein